MKAVYLERRILGVVSVPFTRRQVVVGESFTTNQLNHPEVKLTVTGVDTVVKTSDPTGWPAPIETPYKGQDINQRGTLPLYADNNPLLGRVIGYGRVGSRRP